MNVAVKNLLDRAELCLENGQPKMAQRAFDAAMERLGGEENLNNLPEDEFERITHLSEHIGVCPMVTTAIPKAKAKCPKCHGKGLYQPGKLCFDCQGKGYQTVQDAERVQRYWTARKAELDARKAEKAEQTAF